MDSKKLFYTIILAIVIWLILWATLVFVIEVPFTWVMVMRLTAGSAMIGMAYYFIITRKDDKD